MKYLILALVLCSATVASAGASSTSKTMDFDSCKQLQDGFIEKMKSMGGTYSYIVNTSVLTIVKAYTNDGSGDAVLVSCSAPDRKMITTISTED